MFKFIKRKITSIFSKFSIGKKLKNLFSRKIDDSLFEDLEKLFYESDLGVRLSVDLTEKIKAILKKDPDLKIDEILNILKNELKKEKVEFKDVEMKKPHVIMIVGVNGGGKTTSIAKLAHYYKKQNKKVLLIAADTFRAAAVDQLSNWAKKVDVDIIKSQIGADPSAVVFDGLKAALSRDIDIVLIDTAGRLHTKTDLMQELEKIKKVSSKVVENSPHETILIVDATTGQNAIDQARIFNSYTPITSIFLTKLDGSAKGGIVLSIQKQINASVKWIGTGEKMEDISKFSFDIFIDDLLSLE